MINVNMNTGMKTLGAWLLCGFLIGCDGGIFGTGDGSGGGLIVENADVGIVDETPSIPGTSLEIPAEADNGADSPEVDSVNDTDAPAAAPIAEPDTPAASPPDQSTVDTVTIDSIELFNAQTDITVSSGANASFTNAFVVNSDNSTQLQFLNLTGTSVGVFASNDPSAIGIALTSDSVLFDSGEVPEATGALLIDAINDSGERTTLTTLDPIILTEGSTSLVILRRLQPTTDIVVLPLASGAVAQDQVAVRFVSAALIADPLTPSTLTLESSVAIDPTLPEGPDQPLFSLTFQPVTFENPVTSYQLIGAQNVALNDDAGRYTDVSIDLDLPGSVITVVLDPSLPNQHVVLIDSP